jgi:tRNA threonylcarbamoyladenosine biosynthesis protein TsaE
MNRYELSQDVCEYSGLEAFAGRVASVLATPLVIHLVGPLGAGKTTFVRALLKAMGYSGRVKSPTYGLLERYDTGDFTLLHLDLYRLEDPGELEFLALRDLYSDNTVLLVEWPGRGGAAIPAADIELRFSDSIIERTLLVGGCSPTGDELLQKLSDKEKISILD